KVAKVRIDDAGRLTEISIQDAADVTADDVALFGRLADLRVLQILNCRVLNDASVSQLTGLTRLETLALTNNAITDAGVETLVQAFPGLVELDLSSNTNMTGAALKSISGLVKLERLSLLQNRFNDLHTRRLAKLPSLRTLDLRGNMEAGDMTQDARIAAHAGLRDHQRVRPPPGEARDAVVAGGLPLPGIRQRRRAGAGGPAADAADPAGPPRRRRSGAGGAGEAAAAEAALPARTGQRRRRGAASAGGGQGTRGARHLEHAPDDRLEHRGDRGLAEPQGAVDP
ncbi:MAG: hypothetical protein EBX36_08190, partial [Planctomycetia bacterium]|nr:hypothetical protein [Planctomycetia bacterium]